MSDLIFCNHYGGSCPEPQAGTAKSYFTLQPMKGQSVAQASQVKHSPL